MLHKIEKHQQSRLPFDDDSVIYIGYADRRRTILSEVTQMRTDVKPTDNFAWRNAPKCMHDPDLYPCCAVCLWNNRTPHPDELLFDLRDLWPGLTGRGMLLSLVVLRPELKNPCDALPGDVFLRCRWAISFTLLSLISHWNVSSLSMQFLSLQRGLVSDLSPHCGAMLCSVHKTVLEEHDKTDLRGSYFKS